MASAIAPPMLEGDERFGALAELTRRLGAPRRDAVAAASQGQFDAAELLVYLVDCAKPELLPLLAEQFHVGGDEGWLLANGLPRQRELIKRAIEVHRHKGTRWALNEVFRVLGVQVELSEWWQQSPPAPTHTFNLTAWVNDNLLPGRPVLNPELYDRLRRMTDLVKPARSAYQFKIGAAFSQPLRWAGAARGRAVQRNCADCRPNPAKPLPQSLCLAGALKPRAVMRTQMETSR